MKNVLITGSTSGIGLATARLFAKNGYFVILNGRREELGKEIERTIQAIGKCKYIKADVSSPTEVIWFLATNEAMTGSQVIIDGGWCLNE